MPKPSCSPSTSVTERQAEIDVAFENNKQDLFELHLPDCWSMQQKQEFCENKDWLIVKQKKLGCTICKQIGTLGTEKSQGLKIPKEWANCSVTDYGNTNEKKQSLLPKKIHEHRESSAHTVALKIFAEGK